MNVKYIVKFVGSAMGAGAAVRNLAKARRDDDKLRMIDAVLSVASVAVTVALVIREIRESRESGSRLTELKDDA